MKILLVYPYFIEDRIHTGEIAALPMGLYSIAAVLMADGHEVDVVNWHAAQRTPEIVEATIRGKQPDVVGVSIFHANRWGGIEIAGWVKAVDPGIRVVFGGIGATFLWRHLLTHFEAIDYVVLGEGEETIRELIAHFERGLPAAEDIRGLALRCRGQAVCTGSRPHLSDLDALPLAARHFTYQHVALTRGCPSDCAFCGSPAFWGRRVRFRSTGHFVDELELLRRKGVSFFYVSDDTFTLRKDRVIAVCREILRRGLQIAWAAISRVDRVDEEVLGWMRRAGCTQISYGVESGSEDIRRALNKHFRTEDIVRAFSLTQSHGIMARAYFIYGCPGESHRTIQETVELMDRIKPLGAIFYILDIFPGTALYEAFKKAHKVDDDIWLQRIEDILYFETDPRLSKEAVLSFGKTLRSAFHASLPRYVEDLELVEQQGFSHLHADFCSRLAMTFDQGDYAGVDEIADKAGIAERLYRRALSYHPDARASLGLGILLQKAGRYPASLEVLQDGLHHFPEDCQLHLCAAVSRMNLGDFRAALNHLEPFDSERAALQMAIACHRALGDEAAAAAGLRRLEGLKT